MKIQMVIGLNGNMTEIKMKYIGKTQMVYGGKKNTTKMEIK